MKSANLPMSCFVALIVAVAGCNHEGMPPAGSTTDLKVAKVTEIAEKPHDDHSGWWCPEHGIPEEECSMCSDKAAADFKAKGDWCDKHDRAKSQCFICYPSLKEKFAARYRAKYGKEPPPIEEPAVN